jgi:peptidoglycan hydrolase CwlO-like protein
MKGSELLAALADARVRRQVQRLLGLPTDAVARRLDALARGLVSAEATLTRAQARTDKTLETLVAAQARTDETVKALAAEVKALAAAQARTDETVKALAAEVKALAAAQARTDETVKALAAAQARTDETVKALAAAQARTDETVKALAAAQARTDETVKALAAAQARTDETVKALAAAQARTEEAVRELARAIKETRQAVAALADNVGFGLEELAALVLPDILRQRRGVAVTRFERRFFTTSQGEEEVDLYGEADRGGEPVVVVGEVKSRIYRAEVERFARRVDRLREHVDRPLVPVLFGFVVHPSAAPSAEEAGILLVASRPSSAAA